MTETKSIPVLLDDNTVAFDDVQDLGMVLVGLCNDGTSWLFIAGADALRLQHTVKLSLGLRDVPRPVVPVECTPRYQSPGAVACELRLLETQEGRAALDGLLAVVAAVRDGGAPPSGSTGQSPGDMDSFDEGEPTSPDVEFGSFPKPDEPTRKIESVGVEQGDNTPEVPESEMPEPEMPESSPDPRPETRAPALTQERKDLKGALEYNFTGLHSIDQLLGAAGGLDTPAPATGGPEDPVHLLLTLFEFLGMKRFTGIVRLEWKDAKPIESTMVFVRKGDLIRLEDQGDGQPGAEESFLRFLETEKIIYGKEAGEVRSLREESGKSIGSLLFEGNFLSLDKISTYIRSHKEESFFELLYREGSGIARVRPKAKVKGHPIRLNLTRNSIVWVRKVLMDKYRRDLDPFIAQWMQSYPQVNQNSIQYPVTWLLRAKKELKTAETVLTGAKIAQETFDLAPVSQHELARLFFLLTRYGALDWRDLPVTSNDSNVLTSEQQLEHHLAYLRDSNPFNRLGVHWATHPKDIEAKYRVVERKYGPESRYATHSDQTRALCNEISDLLRTSRDRLMDRRTRMEERSRIVEVSQGRFAAQFMEKQARIIKFRGDIVLACQTLEMAIEIHPNAQWLAILKAWKADVPGK